MALPLAPVLGSIPAQAGEPYRTFVPCRPIWVYPRAGGGTPISLASRTRNTGLSPRRRGTALEGLVAATKPGLSPRRRGNRGDDAVEPLVDGSIPAQAGEPARRGTISRTSRVYPRAGGGTRAAARPGLDQDGLSPRRRGNPHPELVVASGIGSIPAQAGEPAGSGLPRCPRRVYPRAGGGTTTKDDAAKLTAGLSPRRRGNRKSDI